MMDYQGLLRRRTRSLGLGPGVGHHLDRAAPLGTGHRASMPPARTLPEVLLHWAETHPEQPSFYLVDLEERLITLTAGDLLAAARWLGASLRRWGVVRGDRVVISLETGPELLAVFFACGLLGAIPCLVDLPSSKVSLDAWRARFRGKVELLKARGVVIDQEFVPAARATLGGACEPFVFSVQDLPVDAEPFEMPVLSSEETAFIQFTSGTTASPRGVQISHASLLANICCIGQTGYWASGDLMVGWLPLFHDMGLVATTLAAFVHGISTVLMPPMGFLLKPARWLWALHYFRGTLSFAPNFAYQLCVRRIRDAEIADLDLSTWRRAYNAAEFIHGETLHGFAGRFAPCGFDAQAFHPAYGMAEMVVGATCRDANEAVRIDTISRTALSLKQEAVPVLADNSDTLTVVSVGRLFPGHEIKIVDEAGNSLGERQEGEILLRGPSVFGGYYQDPEASAQVLRQGWLWTGDVGYVADGQIFICGRRKDLIIKGGEKYHPYVMESAAAKVAGVRAGCVAAVGVSNPREGTEDVAIVFETAETALERLRQICRLVEEQVFLEAGVRPDRVVPVAPQSLPKTSSGKIRRAQVQEYL